LQFQLGSSISCHVLIDSSKCLFKINPFDILLEGSGQGMVLKVNSQMNNAVYLIRSEKMEEIVYESYCKVVSL
jgi:hypothetical protein